MYPKKWRFYFDLAVVHVEGLTAPLPYLRVCPRVCPPSWECNCARGDFLGANSCPQASSHLLWERIYLPLAPCTWLPPGLTPLPGRIYPKGVSGVAGVLHESGCSTLALFLWPWSHLSLLFITVPWLSGVWGLPTASPPPWSLSYPWVSGSNAVVALLLYHFTLASPHLGDALLGDALSWRRFPLATLPLGDALPWRCLPLALPHLGDALRWLWPRCWLWPWFCQRPGTGRYIFHTRCNVLENICSLIVDGGSCCNCCSTRLIEKLNLQVVPHPKPYNL